MSSRPDHDRPDRPSTAQPAPKVTPPKGASVHDFAAREAFAYGYPRVGRLVLERRAFGLRKYSTLLRAHNGRDPYCDAVEELLDALAYLAQAREEDRPGASELFHAVLAVTGAVTRRLPPEAALPPAGAA